MRRRNRDSERAYARDYYRRNGAEKRARRRLAYAEGRWRDPRQEMAAAHVARRKRGGVCVDCGLQPDNPTVLDYDHVRGSKVFEVSKARARGSSPEEIDAEIAKCDLVCANCHRLRTASRCPSRRPKKRTDTERGQTRIRFDDGV